MASFWRLFCLFVNSHPKNQCPKKSSFITLVAASSEFWCIIANCRKYTAAAISKQYNPHQLVIMAGTDTGRIYTLSSRRSKKDCNQILCAKWHYTSRHTVWKTSVFLGPFSKWMGPTVTYRAAGLAGKKRSHTCPQGRNQPGRQWQAALHDLNLPGSSAPTGSVKTFIWSWQFFQTLN